MRLLRPLLFALCMLSALAAQLPARAATPPPILAGVHRVVCLGDSITQGGEGPGGYVWLVRHYLNALYPTQNIETINAGISGNKTTDMLARFQHDVLDRKPDLITISVGVNDVWHGFYDNHPLGDGPRGIPLPDYFKNVEALVTAAEKTGAKVVILSTTVIHEDQSGPENRKVEGYNAALRVIANEHNARFVDFQKPFWAIIGAYQQTTGGRDLVLTVDGVHMNGFGNRVMAFALLQGLGISSEDRASVTAAIDLAQKSGK